MVTFFYYSCLVTAILSFLFGAIVLFNRPKGGILNPITIWILFCFSVMFWSLGLGLMSTSHNQEKANFWIKIHYIGATFIPTVFLHFVFLFTDKIKKLKRVLLVCYFLTFVFQILSLFGLIAIAIPKPPFTFYTAPGKFYNIYSFYFAIATVWAHMLLFLELVKSTGYKKNQIYYILLGCGIGFIGGATVFFPVYNINFPLYGMGLVPIYVLTVSYAIINYKLMDINLASRYSLVNFILSLILSLPLVLVTIFTNSLYACFATGLFLVILTPWIFSEFRHILTNWVDHLPIYRKYLGRQERVLIAVEKILKAKTTKECAQLGVNACVEVFPQVEKIFVLLWDQDHLAYWVAGWRGLDLTDSMILSLGQDNAVVSHAKEKKQIILREYLQYKIKQQSAEVQNLKVFSDIVNELAAMNVEIMRPLFNASELLGFLCFKSPQNGRMFNELDLQDIDTVSRIIEDVLRSMSSEGKQAQFGARIAHDIIRPFSGKVNVLGLLEIVVGGKLGPINDHIKEVLLQVKSELGFVSRFLKDFLNPKAAFEGVKYEIIDSNLTEVFLSIKSRYQLIVQEKGLVLDVQVPPENLIVRCDLMVVQWRIMTNFLENALRYARAKIEISFEVRGRFLRINVKDDGQGISKENQLKLFKSGEQLGAQNKGKMGAGLFNSKEAALAMNGNVGVESEPGKFTNFYLELEIV